MKKFTTFVSLLFVSAGLMAAPMKQPVPQDAPNGKQPVAQQLNKQAPKKHGAKEAHGKKKEHHQKEARHGKKEHGKEHGKQEMKEQRAKHQGAAKEPVSLKPAN
ncbi:hypothetical protein [Neisseria sp. S1]|uniref:hypothetical protein n=1 Tax=Neisseria sp. S1 TaxID=3318354 RepID=UPI003A8BC3B4